MVTAWLVIRPSKKSCLPGVRCLLCNSTVATLHLSGWICPPHLTAGQPATATFWAGAERASSLLDYWICSPSLLAVHRQLVAPPRSGHASVTIQLPPIARESELYVTPSTPTLAPPSPPVATCSRVNWADVAQCIQRSLHEDNPESAWQEWCRAYHQQLLDRGARGPPHPPGGPLDGRKE